MFGITGKRLARILSALTLTLVLVLVLATMTAASSPIVHRVSVGGPDYCSSIGLSPGCDKNFSLVAFQYADGSASGQYTDRFGGGWGGFHAVIDCLVVDGNKAWISGVVTQGVLHDPVSGEDFDLVGQPVSTRVRDNGTSAKDPADQISMSHFFEHFKPCTETPDHLLFDVPQGQVKVR